MLQSYLMIIRTYRSYVNSSMLNIYFPIVSHEKDGGFSRVEGSGKGGVGGKTDDLN